MTSTSDEAKIPRDVGNWAAHVDRLHVDRSGSNVDGRRLTGPIQGFGQMWQKTYRVGVADRDPRHVVAEWKAHFPEFWPSGNRFDGALTGINPGDIALLNLAMGGGVKLSTGVYVMYADDESFTLMTPQGHMFAGWITFSAFGESGGGTVAQAQILMRASDPVYELGMLFGGHRKEDRFWQQTLAALADRLGLPAATVDTTAVCVDHHRQWRYVRNVWHNAAIRSMLRMATAPVRALLPRRGRSTPAS